MPLLFYFIMSGPSWKTAANSTQERTLGVITKPDRLSKGSGSEAKFLELARNEDVFFKLGWHVIKNRKFEETEFSIQERNLSENTFFSTSNFNTLPKENVGIDALRVKLSHLLFDHVKKELPRLQDDLENALKSAQDELHLLGESRSTVAECRTFLAQLNMDCHDICKAGLGGHYEHDHFRAVIDETFSLKSSSTIARIRAAVQYANTVFSDEFRKTGHKYQITFSSVEEDPPSPVFAPRATTSQPRVFTKNQALQWVRRMLLQSRGSELVGNFNPHLIAELFWEQSDPWEKLAKSHIKQVSRLCEKFLSGVLERNAPKDLKTRIW